MDRRDFIKIIPLGLVGCYCELDDMDVKQNWWKYGTTDNAAAAVQIGDLINDDFNRASLGGDYSLTTTDATASIVSNKLQYNKPTSGTFGDTRLLNTSVYSMLNDFYSSITFELKQLNTTSNGLALGVKGSDTSIYRDIAAFYNTKTNSANYKKIHIFQRDSGTNNTKVISSASTWTPALDDVIKIEVSMVKWLFSVTVTNITQTGSTPLTSSYQFGYSSPELIQTPFNPAIWNVGGQHNITEYIFGSDEYKNSHVCIIGDSTMQGVGATTYSNTSQGRIESNQTGDNKVTRCALGSAISDNVVSALDNLTLINADYYLIRIGSNDVHRNIGGDGEQNALDNLATIVSTLEGIGKTVILTTPLARTGTSMGPYALGIQTDFPSNKIVDSYTFSRDGVTTNLNPAWTADGTHLNDTGQSEDYTDIIDDAPEIL